MLRFRSSYFFLSILLLVVEICIALFVHDDFIRPFVGDFLVVFLIYFVLRCFFTFGYKSIAWFTLVFSFTIEIGQYFNLVGLLGLENYKWARIIIGTSFHWLDLLAYALGVAAVMLLDKKWIIDTKPTS